MSEIILFDAASRRSLLRHRQQSQQFSYEMYAAYRQAELAFRAFYFGTPLDAETTTSCPLTQAVRRHWKTVERLAEIGLREKSLRREQVLKLLLHASLDAALGGEV